MIPDDLEALALADAIGALDEDERVALDARVALLTPDERAHVASLYDVALALAALGGTDRTAGARARRGDGGDAPARRAIPCSPAIGRGPTRRCPASSRKCCRWTRRAAW